MTLISNTNVCHPRMPFKLKDVPEIESYEDRPNKIWNRTLVYPSTSIRRHKFGSETNTFSVLRYLFQNHFMLFSKLAVSYSHYKWKFVRRNGLNVKHR